MWKAHHRIFLQQTQKIMKGFWLVLIFNQKPLYMGQLFGVQSSPTGTYLDHAIIALVAVTEPLQFNPFDCANMSQTTFQVFTLCPSRLIGWMVKKTCHNTQRGLKRFVFHPQTSI